VEQEQPEVEQLRYRLAVSTLQVLLVEVQRAARAESAPRFCPAGGIAAALLEADGAPHCIAQVDLPVHHVCARSGSSHPSKSA